MIPRSFAVTFEMVLSFSTAGRNCRRGAATVSSPEPAVTSPETKRRSIPVGSSAHPGSVDLTGERVAEILNEEDAAP